jgi:hypothetical protein
MELTDSDRPTLGAALSLASVGLVTGVRAWMGAMVGMLSIR